MRAPRPESPRRRPGPGEPPVFRLWFCGSAPFVGVSDLDAPPLPPVVGPRDPPVLLSLLLSAARPAPGHIGKIALLNSPDDIGEERSALILYADAGSRMSSARCAGVGSLHRLRSCCYAA